MEIRFVLVALTDFRNLVSMGSYGLIDFVMKNQKSRKKFLGIKSVEIDKALVDFSHIIYFCIMYALTIYILPQSQMTLLNRVIVVAGVIRAICITHVFLEYANLKPHYLLR